MFIVFHVVHILYKPLSVHVLEYTFWENKKLLMCLNLSSSYILLNQLVLFSFLNDQQ